MSATGRSGTSRQSRSLGLFEEQAADKRYERQAEDFYATPYWATRAIKPLLRGVSLDEPSSRVLDPFAGEGAILDCFADVGRCGIELDALRAIETKKLHTFVSHGDALDPKNPWPKSTAVVTNPPYDLAVHAILRALEHQANTPGMKDVAFLLRVNFLGAQKRADFHKRHPSDLYILPRRPQYVCSISCENKKQGCRWGMMIPYLPTGELREDKPGKCGACGAGIVASSSDATEYAWFVWGPGRGGRWSILDVEAA